MITVKKLYESDLTPEILELLKKASFFSSLGYAKIWSTAGGKPVVWAAFENERATALLIGVEWGRGWLKRFQAMPDGCYVQIVSDDNASENSISALLTAIANHSYAKMFLFDFDNKLNSSDLFDRLDLITLVVDISSSDWEPPDKKLQSEIRKSEREGVKIVPCKLSDDHNPIDQFMDIVEQSAQRHGQKPRYSRAFYKAIGELAETDSRILWHNAIFDDEVVGSHLNFIQDDMLFNWQVYSDRDRSELKANQYLLYSAAKEASSRGVKRLNLGASPDGASSLLTYKKKWGGENHQYQCLRRYSWLGRLR